jgi:hypothetical protein
MSRYRSGNPLPPGGTFILNRRAVLLDELFRLHLEAAHGLGVPFDAITVDIEMDARGRPVPKVDVKPPPGWMPDVPKRVIIEAGDNDKVMSEYIAGYLKVLYGQMSDRITVRVKSLSQVRAELAPKEIIRAQEGTTGQADPGEAPPTG